jgi:predicted dehydrogenase
MHKTPVFGVIGTGFIGRIHLKALQAAGLTVGALADPSSDALASASQFAPDARHYADWAELLADPAITAVNICTINALHFPVLKAAIASGKHVFCEKTMTTSAAEAHEALALPVAAGQVVQIGYMKRFFPASVWAKEQLHRIGTPICATVRSFQGGLVTEKIYDSSDWRPANGEPSRTRRFASGGMLNMAGSHMLDVTAWLLGDPKSVTCRTWSPEGYDAELHAHGLFEMHNGTLVHFEAALPHSGKTGEYKNGWEELIQINGTKGRLEIVYPLWDRPADFAARARVYIEASQTWEEPIFPPADAFRLELEAFAASCRSGALTGPSIREGAVVDCWIDACYTSARTGQAVAVALS